MSSTAKCLSIFTASMILLILAFSAGVCFGPYFVIVHNPIQSSSTIISVCPTPEKPLYSTDDYARANRVVDEFLQMKCREARYSKLDLKYIVTPESSGYIIHTHSDRHGIWGREFPAELEAEAYIVFDNSLNNYKTEQDAAVNCQR